MIFVKGPLSQSVEARLRHLCARERVLTGADYGATFARVVEAGIEAVEHRGMSQFADQIKRFRGASSK